MGRGFLSKHAGGWCAVKEIWMLLILVIIPHKVFSVQCPEPHASDNPGPGHPKHVQMTPHSHHYEGRRKRNGKDSMRSAIQPNPKGTEGTPSYEQIEKEQRETCLSINDDLRMMEFCTSFNFLTYMFCI